MGFAGKIIDKKTKWLIDKHFMNYEAIKTGIAKAKVEREDPGARIGNVGYQRPDPTGNKAIRNVSEIEHIGIITNQGKYFLVHHPERWEHIMRDCFNHYRGEMIGDLIVDRYISHRQPQATAGLLRIGETTYHDWVDIFLTDAAVLAAVAGLVPAAFDIGQEQELFV